MAKKRKLLDIENVLVTLKAWIVSIIALLVLIIPTLLGVFLRRQGYPTVGTGVHILTLIGYLWVWGYIANKFWNWK